MWNVELKLNTSIYGIGAQPNDKNIEHKLNLHQNLKHYHVSKSIDN